jgi:hypothetical protein
VEVKPKKGSVKMFSLVFAIMLTSSNHYQIQATADEVIVECTNGHHCNAEYPWVLIENGKSAKPSYMDTYQVAFGKPKGHDYIIKFSTCDDTVCQAYTVHIKTQY